MFYLWRELTGSIHYFSLLFLLFVTSLKQKIVFFSFGRDPRGDRFPRDPRDPRDPRMPIDPRMAAKSNGN